MKHFPVNTNRILAETPEEEPGREDRLHRCVLELRAVLMMLAIHYPEVGELILEVLERTEP